MGLVEVLVCLYRCVQGWIITCPFLAVRYLSVSSKYIWGWFRCLSVSSGVFRFESGAFFVPSGVSWFRLVTCLSQMGLARVLVCLYGLSGYLSVSSSVFRYPSVSTGVFRYLSVSSGVSRSLSVSLCGFRVGSCACLSSQVCLGLD